MTKLTRDRGASAVEFALILPLLLLIIFIIIEGGLLLYNKQVITNASREGARAGIVARNPRLPWDGTGNPCPPAGCPSIDDVVIDYTRGRLFPVVLNIPPEDVNTVNLTTGGGYVATAPFGEEISVTVTYRYSFLVLHNIANAFFGGSIGSPIALSAVTVMRYE